MTSKELFALIKRTFPEDFDKYCLINMDLGFGFNENDAYRTSFTTSTGNRLEYILVDNDTRIARIDRSHENLLLLKKIMLADVWVDVIDKLTMEPTVRIKNPEHISLENGSIWVGLSSSKTTLEAKKDCSEMPSDIRVNLLQNHVLIYRAELKMSREEIATIPFPTKIDDQNRTLFTPKQIFDALTISDVVDFFNKNGWGKMDCILDPIGHGSEGCIIKNIQTDQNVIVAVRIGSLVPEATIIFPNGRSFKRNLYDLKPSLRPVNVLTEGENRIMAMNSDKIRYNSGKDTIGLNNLSIDFDIGTIVVL